MNYKKIYDQIIQRAMNRKLSGYKERHHIIPRCMGGTNNIDNLVELTAREHFIVHKLLCEIYTDNRKLLFALTSMMYRTTSNDNSRNYIISSREFDRIKIQRSILGHSDDTKNKISENNSRYWKGKSTPRLGTFGIDGKGTKHSEATKEKIRASAALNPNFGRTGKPASEETLKKMSIALKGKPGMNGSSNPAYKFICKDELTQMIKNNIPLKMILKHFNIVDSTLYRKYKLYFNCKNHTEVVKLLK